VRAASDILLNRFKEGITRSSLIRKDMILIRFDPEEHSDIKKINKLKEFYKKTIEDLIYNGKEYISISSDAEEMIRVAVDLDKYESILRRIN
tara:strand:- start:409 stop:684 length:276 start_codon:yes stop_codon:yes gene_type:complete